MRTNGRTLANRVKDAFRKKCRVTWFALVYLIALFKISNLRRLKLASADACGFRRIVSVGASGTYLRCERSE